MFITDILVFYFPFAGVFLFISFGFSACVHELDLNKVSLFNSDRPVCLSGGE